MNMGFLKRNYAIIHRIRFLHCLWIFAVFCGFILSGEISIYAQNTEINHRGFSADFSRINDSPEKDTIIKAIKRQIEIVEKVKISQDDLSFFKSVLIVMLSARSGMPGVLRQRQKNSLSQSAILSFRQTDSAWLTQLVKKRLLIISRNHE